MPVNDLAPSVPQPLADMVLNAGFLVWELLWTRTTRTPAFWDTPSRPMITHTSDSHQIPNQEKTKLMLQILKNCQKFKYWNVARNFDATHLLMLLNMMYKYEMDPTRTLGTTERTQNAGQTDGQTRRTEWNQYTPQQLCCARGIISVRGQTAHHNKGWN